MKLPAVLAVVCLCGAGLAQNGITLVYPRSAGTGVFTYDDAIDSSFVLGNVQPPGGSLWVNNQPVPQTERGAFLAFLPIVNAPGTKSWQLTLISVEGDTLDKLEFPYRLKSEITADPRPDSTASFRFPRVVVVTDSHAQTRTCVGGSYEYFPVPRTKLLAVGYVEPFFELDFGANRRGVIERRFVEAIDDAVLGRSALGDGRCSSEDGADILSFRLAGAPVWSSALSSDGKSLLIRLVATDAVIDRFAYLDRVSGVDDVVWVQTAEALELEIRCREPIRRGYSINIADEMFIVRIPKPIAARDRKLRGKIVVVDAGHGGDASGAVGPLGTREKDVVLRLAGMVERELRRAGAIVVQSRVEDRNLSLYERVEIARKAQADFFLSLHANALPDGSNPFVRTGSGTYFYTSSSRRAAEIVQRHLLAATGLRDDGVHDANFAVVRPTDFPAVLVETAYLMNPAEEELLLDDRFLSRVATGLAHSLKEYFGVWK